MKIEIKMAENRFHVIDQPYTESVSHCTIKRKVSLP